MTLEQLRHLNIGILGFGKEGQAVLEYLHKHQLSATVYDKKAESEWTEQQQALLATKKTKTITGPKYLTSALSSSQVLFKSPGVLLSVKQKQQITEQKIHLTSQTAWFFEHCPTTIVGVTGTKGKGTTSSLIAEMLKNANHSVFLTGNIGMHAPMSFLDDLTTNDTVVFELSSFQLENMNRSPQIGICLMVTTDHLDYHSDRDEYWSAKIPIAKFQTENDVLIYNFDYEGSRSIGELGAGQKYKVSTTEFDEPGAVIVAKQQRIVLQTQVPWTLDTSKRKLKGNHNLENIAAAALAGAALKLQNDAILKAVQEFPGLPHRLQYFGTWNGISFYDDSIATNPDTVIAAVRSFTEPLILILGGADKGLDYSELVTELTHSAQLKAIITVGKVGKLLKKLLSEAKFSKQLFGSFPTFEQAVHAACSSAQSGDAVLLSPAGTSFDMFQSYADRGARFQKLVKTHYGQN